MVFINTLAILGIFCLGLAIVGTIGNTLIFFICILKLRNEVTFIFIAFLAVVDMVSLFEWNLTHFTDAFYTINLLMDTIPKCRLLAFFQMTSLQASAWLLVIHIFDCYELCTNSNLMINCLSGSDVYRKIDKRPHSHVAKSYFQNERSPHIFFKLRWHSCSHELAYSFHVWFRF